MSNSRVSTWSGIRNKLENDYLCPALRGRIQYFATSYSKSADHEGRAAIRLDGVEVLRSNYYTYFENVWTKFHHLRSTTLKDHDSAKEAINQAHAYALEQGPFDPKVFYEAFGIFDNQSIEKSLMSENPLVRIFALLDRRLGKRRLLALEDSMEQELDWVRAFYVIRMQAEGLMDREYRGLGELCSMNFSDIVQGEDGFLVELRCNNTFQVQLFGKIKAYLLENQPAWKAAGAIPIPDAVAMFNLIDQLAGGNRYWSEETGRQAEDALFELQEIIDSLEET